MASRTTVWRPVRWAPLPMASVGLATRCPTLLTSATGTGISEALPTERSPSLSRAGVIKAPRTELRGETEGGI